MTTDRQQKPRKTEWPREQYLRILGRPTLSDQVVDEMRRHVIRLAQTICEHVWGKRFY
jgi:hypothetical protein